MTFDMTPAPQIEQPDEITALPPKTASAKSFFVELLQTLVLAALLYYREHKTELDAQDAADTQQSLEMHRRYAKKPGQP